MSTWQVPVVKSAILALLAANSGAHFTVEGYQRQSHAAEEIAGQLRHVTVYYRSGAFDKAKSGWVAGPFKHAMTFAVELVLAAASTTDLSALTSPSASAQARMTALSASLTAAANADALWDELSGLVWNILVDPVNMQLGLTSPVIADRWISNIQKSSPPPQGEFVLISGTMDYTCTVVEQVVGATPVTAGANAIDVTLNETIDQTFVGSGTAPDNAKLDPAKQGAKSSP